MALELSILPRIPNTLPGRSEIPLHTNLEQVILDASFRPGRILPDNVRRRSFILGPTLEREFALVLEKMRGDVLRREIGKPLFAPWGGNALRVPDNSAIRQGKEKEVSFDDVDVLRGWNGIPIEQVASFLHTHEGDYPPSNTDFVGIALADGIDGAETVGLVAGSVKNHAIFRGPACMLNFATEEEALKWVGELDNEFNRILKPVRDLSFRSDWRAKKLWKSYYGNKNLVDVMQDICYAFTALVCQTYGFIWMSGPSGGSTLQEVDYRNPRDN